MKVIIKKTYFNINNKIFSDPTADAETNRDDHEEDTDDMMTQIKMEANTNYNPNSTSQLSNENLKSEISLGYLDR